MVDTKYSINSLTVGAILGLIEAGTIAITVEEVKEENNTIVVPIQSNELNSTSNNNAEESDAVSGILGLGLLGGGGYWGYKKYKKTKK